MKPVVTVVLLWLIAIVTTFLLVEDPRVRTTLGPVFAVCMIGCVVTVRRASRSS